jgi:hypothetical protein
MDRRQSSTAGERSGACSTGLNSANRHTAWWSNTSDTCSAGKRPTGPGAAAEVVRRP